MAAWVFSCPADTLYRVPDIPELVRENIQQYMETELHIPPSQVTSSLPHSQPQPMLLCCCLSAGLHHAAACLPTYHWQCRSQTSVLSATQPLAPPWQAWW